MLNYFTLQNICLVLMFVNKRKS